MSMVVMAVSLYTGGLGVVPTVLVKLIWSMFTDFRQIALVLYAKGYSNPSVLEIMTTQRGMLKSAGRNILRAGLDIGLYRVPFVTNFLTEKLNMACGVWGLGWGPPSHPYVGNVPALPRVGIAALQNSHKGGPSF